MWFSLRCRLRFWLWFRFRLCINYRRNCLLFYGFVRLMGGERLPLFSHELGILLVDAFAERVKLRLLVGLELIKLAVLALYEIVKTAVLRDRRQRKG